MLFVKGLKLFLCLTLLIINDIDGFLTGLKPSNNLASRFLVNGEGYGDSTWSERDDWEALSEQNPDNAMLDSSKILGQDIMSVAALEMMAMEPEGNYDPSAEDVWLDGMINGIMSPDYESSTKEEDMIGSSEDFEEDMDNEIAMLVRCNQQPEKMLVQEGRAVRALSEDEKNDPLQLASWDASQWTMTEFFNASTKQMFKEHARTHPIDKELVMDDAAVATWMTKSLKDEGVVGKHDRRVVLTVSMHGTYGKGYLTLSNFQDLYLAACVGKSGKYEKDLQFKHRNSSILGVWRDLQSHGIDSPNQSKRAEDVKAMPQHNQKATVDTLLDECELLFEDSDAPPEIIELQGRSSHEKVELASDEQTPVYMKDGEFVFIDEESCIGCVRCTEMAPSAFRMLDNGRARAFKQRNTPEVRVAVSVCPARCMHYVDFRGLKELETARDQGGTGDGSKLGFTEMIPLHVSGIESDTNRRSSWYHYLKQKCHMSNNCPKRGCFDCPHYSQSGDNPYFQERLRQAYHVRAEHFIETGAADTFRKTADL